MKYYVFIARDEEEFARYPGSGLGYKELRRDFVKAIRYKVIDGIYCTLILSSDVKATVRGQENDDVGIMCHKVAASINAVAEDAGLSGAAYIDAEGINLFVHVGGEGKAGIEDLENKIKEEVDGKCNEKKKDTQLKWQFMLLSSRHPGRIDVTKPQIILPDSGNALNMLLRRCEKSKNKLNENILKGFENRVALDKTKTNGESTDNNPSEYETCCKDLSIIKGVN